MVSQDRERENRKGGLGLGWSRKVKKQDTNVTIRAQHLVIALELYINLTEATITYFVIRNMFDDLSGSILSRSNMSLRYD